MQQFIKNGSDVAQKLIVGGDSTMYIDSMMASLAKEMYKCFAIVKKFTNSWSYKRTHETNFGYVMYFANRAASDVGVMKTQYWSDVDVLKSSSKSAENVLYVLMKNYTFNAWFGVLFNSMKKSNDLVQWATGIGGVVGKFNEILAKGTEITPTESNYYNFWISTNAMESYAQYDSKNKVLGLWALLLAGNLANVCNACGLSLNGEAVNSNLEDVKKNAMSIAEALGLEQVQTRPLYNPELDNDNDKMKVD